MIALCVAPVDGRWDAWWFACPPHRLEGMGRKRKAGSIPSPLVPSLLAVARPESSAERRTKKNARGGGQRYPRQHRVAAPPQSAERPTPTAPTSTSPPPLPQPGPTCASGPLDGAIQALLSPPTPPKAPAPLQQPAEESTSNGAPASSMLEDEPGKSRGRTAAASAELGLTPSDVIGLLPASGWRLGSCWGPECGCLAFKPAAPPPLSDAGLATVCACGHRSGAHELVDANDDAEEAPVPPNRHQERQQYRYYPGDGDSSAGTAAAANETEVRLRRLFSAIRNARAVGDCGLFEDSEGVRGWGSGWFLSRCVRNSGRLYVVSLRHDQHQHWCPRMP